MFGFKKNMGLLDRILRILMALVTFYFTFTKSDSIAFSIVMVILGLFFLIVGLIGRSPLYKLLGTYSDDRP
ncbi:DUF2892 domain-containing protein [bacterium]|jgi:uncharacterized membrane protein|nr:DUF2892 domain-containing protein [bacterium]